MILKKIKKFIKKRKSLWFVIFLTNICAWVGLNLKSYCKDQEIRGNYYKETILDYSRMEFPATLFNGEKVFKNLDNNQPVEIQPYYLLAVNGSTGTSNTIAIVQCGTI